MRFLVIAAIVVASGCFRGGFPDAKPPRTGVQANGQPLAIVENTETWQQRDNVGEVRVEDENGQRLATGDVYATRTHSKSTWTAVQGNEKLSDEDFFRIADQPWALAQTQRERKDNVVMNRRGRYMVLGGAIGMVVGLVLPGVELKFVGVLTGFSVGCLGLHTMMVSHDRQKEHVVPVWDAQEIADRYNRKLGLSVSRQF